MAGFGQAVGWIIAAVGVLLIIGGGACIGSGASGIDDVPARCLDEDGEIDIFRSDGCAEYAGATIGSGIVAGAGLVTLIIGIVVGGFGVLMVVITRRSGDSTANAP